MAISLSRFRVLNLHGQRTWDVPIIDNRLVLVGENGTGKSTLATLVYYFLARRWSRIAAYRFDAIEAVLNGEKLVVTRDQIDTNREHRQRLQSVMLRSSPFRRRSLEQFLLASASVRSDTDALRRLAAQLDVPFGLALDVMSTHAEESQVTPELQTVEEKIAAHVTGQILLLPTYRRIEQDLQAIFPGSESEISSIRERLAIAREAESFVELVEFGMQDVERAISARLNQIKESIRTALSNLTGTYLRDMIRGVSDVDLAVLKSINHETLEDILFRIGENILPSADKQRLIERVEQIVQQGRINVNDTAVAHFLLKLFELYKEQQSSEKDVRAFVDVCNQYLSGKQIVYDNKNYTISIHQSYADESLEFRALSSGEKQIVSLFVHMYFSGKKEFFVIIDEPELSLSVPWQRRLLPDILRTNLCTGLIAATHSPFIWENEFEKYTHSLAEFAGARDVVR